MMCVERLQDHLAAMGRVLLGYSGGVDSALLAVAGVRGIGAERFLAVIGRSPSYPASQYATALSLAGQFAVPLLEVDTAEGDDPLYRANGADRCYHCKRELWGRLGAIARERGFDTVIDGTNADDLREHRPGMAAGHEHAVRSPLAELGWSKAGVRAAASALGIPTWDSPASPCLSSRIQYGIAVTPERLRQVEVAESYLRALGVQGNLRVRHRGEQASIEAESGMMERLRASWGEIEATLGGLGFSSVTLDPRGYRRGALAAELPVVG